MLKFSGSSCLIGDPEGSGFRGGEMGRTIFVKGALIFSLLDPVVPAWGPLRGGRQDYGVCAPALVSGEKALAGRLACALVIR